MYLNIIIFLQIQTQKPSIKKEEVKLKKEVLSDNELELEPHLGSEQSYHESDVSLESGDEDIQLVKGVKIGEKKKKDKKEKTEDLKKKLELEEHNRYRNEHGIKTVGRHVPPALTDFGELSARYNVSQALVDTVSQCGYDEPTPIQRQAMPSCAPTGSGKTAAFLIPILHSLGAPQGGPRALVLCPTRELAQQIHREALRLSASSELRVSVLRNMKQSKVKEREATIRKSGEYQ
ncbi:putative DEAD box ATP-dependent RNA helicase [Operophtera brumata]|uniref:RNA helicase n=1 Tax=Operophtera brumata TaxID=104452 RepID=A0A0L7LN52_OPEBR|nr:putative DEAD box ATP-dependent RNA helicase [Operophtera brumata]